MTEQVEILIIGAGPAGLSAGAAAAARKRSHVVLERGPAIADTIQKYHLGKLVMANPESMNLQPGNPIGFKEGLREEVLRRFEDGVRAAGVNVLLQHKVVSVTGDAPSFTVTAIAGTGSEERSVTFGARHVVVALGTQGNLIRLTDRKTGQPQPGADLPCVTYQLDDPADFEERGIIVIGGGDSALENAIALAAPELANKVYLITSRDTFPGAKALNVTRIENAIKQARVTHLATSAIERIDAAEDGAYTVRVSGPGGAKEQSGIHAVICRLGADPPKRFLQQAGVEFLSDDPKERPRRRETFETYKPGIYVVGATGDADLIKLAMNEGFEVVEHICGESVVPMDVPLLKQRLADPLGIQAATDKAAVDAAVERVRDCVPIFKSVEPLPVRRLLFNAGLIKEGLDQTSLVVRLRAGEVLFQHKQKGQEVYTLLEGTLRIHLPSADGDRDVDVGPGTLLGELSFFEDSYRNGTATAVTDCLVLSLRRNPLIAAQRSATGLRDTLNLTYATNKLRNFFEPHAPKDPETLARVQDRFRQLATGAEVRQLRNGDVLFRQNDEQEGSDAGGGLLVVRRGSIMISMERDGQSPVVVAHRLAGSVLGESGVLTERKRRSATATAVAPTEILRYPAAGVRQLLSDFPTLRKALENLMSTRLVENGKYVGSDTSEIDDLLQVAGLGEATDILLIQDDLCVGCDNCEAACAGVHADGISRLDREAGKTYANVHVPTTCRHCTNASCMSDCPPDVITRLPTGEIVIDTVNCIGCHRCAENCPYGVIQFVEPPARAFSGLKSLFQWWRPQPESAAQPTAAKATKCDLCAPIIAGTPGGRPACEVACPTGALIRVHPESFLQARDSHE